MTQRSRPVILVLFLLMTAPLIRGQEAVQAPTELEATLKGLEGVVAVRKLEAGKTFQEVFELQIIQPLDHAQPAGETFRQRVYLSHAGVMKPVVLSTEGYAATRPYVTEPTRLFQCNQIIVEHRFFGTSRPDSLRWQYLTVRQSADDLHRVVTILKGIYRGKWLSTGVSKGGQTTILYRYFYPRDVDVSVPYVAPINLTQEDPRPIEFLRHVGSDSCRESMKQFQLAALRNEELLLPLMKQEAKEKGYTFSLGLRRMFEYAVLEYPFAFWQYGRPGRCGRIPGADAPPESLFAHLSDVVGLSMYADAGIKFFQPFMYQAYTEMGYYTYDITDFKALLKEVKNPSNRIFAPPGVDLKFHCEVFNRIDRWIREEAENIILIYGSDDPWTASSPQLTGMTNAIKMVKEGGFHRTKIRDLNPEQKAVVYDALERWMGLPVQR
jgi:hypothetical protein